jgi:uncharacterized membrane-anchored protein
MKKIPYILLLILVGMQLAAAYSLIRSREKVLREGELFRFQTRPIDPADPFQGRYVRLGIRQDYVPLDKQSVEEIPEMSTVYAVLDTDDDGFARFIRLERDRPTDGHYLKTRHRGWRTEWDGETQSQRHLGSRIAIPFDRFYMDEAKAPLAERIALESTRTTNCWVEVRVLNGHAVIEDVYAEGQSLRDLAAREAE